MKITYERIFRFLLLWSVFLPSFAIQAQGQNYLFYYGEPLAAYSKETGFSNFTLLDQDPKTEKYKLNKALTKSFKFLWRPQENKTPVKFPVERFEFDPENDGCTHEAKIVLKGIEPQGLLTSKPLTKRVGSTPREANINENKLAEKLVADYLRRDGYKAGTITAIIGSMRVTAVNLRLNEKNSLIVQADLKWNKKFISMLVILTPDTSKQLEISYAEIYASEMETEATHISFSENIDLGDGEGDRILLERGHWENVDYILLSRPPKKNEWKEELSVNRGC